MRMDCAEPSKKTMSPDAEAGGPALATCQPPDLQLHAVEGLIAGLRGRRHFEARQAGAPTTLDAAHHGGIEGALHGGVARKVYVEEQLVYLGAAEHDGPIILGK